MKKLLLLPFLTLPLWVSPVAAQVEETIEASATPSATPSPTPAPTQEVWVGKIGLGFAQGSTSANPSAGSVNLLNLRYGLSKTVLLDAYFGGAAGNQFDGTATDSNYDPYWNYCLGLGDKINLVEPWPGFWIQEVNRYLYYESSTQVTSNLGNPYQYTEKIHFQNVSLSAGVGFEYFMPFLKNLSLETIETFEFDNSWETQQNVPAAGSLTAASSTSYSIWSVKAVTPGFSFTSLSIHYYF